MIKDYYEKLRFEIALNEMFERLQKSNNEIPAADILEWIQEQMEYAAQEYCYDNNIELFK